MKTVNARELKVALKKAGYEMIRNSSGSHAIYSNGTHKICVPIVNINAQIAKKIIVKCKLKDFL